MNKRRLIFWIGSVILISTAFLVLFVSVNLPLLEKGLAPFVASVFVMGVMEIVAMFLLLGWFARICKVEPRP